ncbi:putative RNA-directed DNA polymerase [Helianthus annuus]|nr:putative RNA-directed DNA polymerase [Helianthus annuus]
MAIVSTARASVLVNGSPTQEFLCHRGLRQGDPLSPFLFILAMEALTGVMKKACSIGLFKGIKVPTQGPELSHFLYADDVVFIGEWSTQNALNLNRILRCFYLSSGLRVNLAKTSIFGVGVDENQVHTLATLLRCKPGSLPFKHLGLQVGANMNLVKNWDPVVSVFRKRLAVWKANTLSFGGRITLVRSVLNALPTYYFSLYKAPSQVINQLEKLRREFLWGATPEQGKMKWVAWKSIMTPKEFGGLGFGSLRDANVAMLVKWWWRFKVDRNSLWRKVIWSLHNNSRSWNFIPVKLSVPGLWKQIVKISSDLENLGINLPSLFRGVPGCNCMMSFWKESWLIEEPLDSKFPNLFQLERQKNVGILDRVRVVGGGISLEFNWSRQPSSQLELAELNDLTAAVTAFTFGAGDDRWMWKPDTTGVFSVSSIRRLIERASFADLGIGFRWNGWVPIKVNFVVWRLVLNRLPTAMDLVHRNINIQDVNCKVCGEENETAVHIFVTCNLAQQVWEFVVGWCKIRPFFILELKDFVDIHNRNRGSKKWHRVILSVVQVAIWVLWKTRNDIVFRHKQANLERIKEEIKTYSYLWIKNRAKCVALSWDDWCNFKLGSMGI